MDLNLKFPDEQTASALLFVEGVNVFTNTDVIGINYDDRTDPPEIKDGWLVNIRLIEGEDASALNDYIILPPNYPKRVWA